MKVQFKKEEIEYPEDTIPVEFLWAYHQQALVEMCKHPEKKEEYIAIRKMLNEIITEWEKIK